MTPFEQAWLQKEFWFDDQNPRAGGTFIGPTARATTTVPDHKKRATKGLGRLTNRKIDYDPYYGSDHVQYDANPSSANSVVTGDAWDDNVLQPDFRTDAKPYNEQELIDRGRDATPETAEFRRGGSLPRTKKVTTDMPSKTRINYKDEKGQDIHGYDKTGKKYLHNDSNIPRHFEGQDREYNTITGVNLATRGPNNMYGGGYHGYDPESEFSFKDTEREAIDGILDTLIHEGTHEAIDENLKDAIKTGELPKENYQVAHEIGAHALEYYGDEDKVNERLKTHPNTGAVGQPGTPERFRGKENQVRMPRPIEGSPLKQAMLKMMLKASMGAPPPKDEDEEDWDDTDPTTTGIPIEEWKKEHIKDSGFIPRGPSFHDKDEKPDPFKGYKPAPAGFDPTKDGRFDPTKDTRIKLPKKDPPAFIEYSMRDWSDKDRGPDYFAASSDEAFTYAWSILKQIA